MIEEAVSALLPEALMSIKPRLMEIASALTQKELHWLPRGTVAWRSQGSKVRKHPSYKNKVSMIKYILVFPTTDLVPSQLEMNK